MHYVSRLPEPERLKNLKDKWQKELLDQILIHQVYSRVSDNYKNKYNQEYVKDTLKSMYNNCCCYCESSLGVTSFAHIEHLKPKSIFPELSFEWDNLHLCCEICNINKSGSWDYNNPILNPSKENIEQFIFLDLLDGFYKPIDSTNLRAINTITHTKINRPELITKRCHLINYVVGIFLKNSNAPLYELRELFGYHTLFTTVIQAKNQKLGYLNNDFLTIPFRAT